MALKLDMWNPDILGSATFPREDGEHEGIRGRQRKKTFQAKTTTDLEWRRGGWRPRWLVVH